MALAVGARLGAYEITGHMGAGGMGEVYRATDTTLARDVAIKVLPESVAQDSSRVARFEQEAKTLAALNHPNIAQIYGLEHSDGAMALVMELVEGPTLADRIAEGPIPADEALHIAMQIADALEAAHATGIVHRDLKPANIKLAPGGAVKVLDFGIAKVLEPRTGISGPQAPSLTTPAMTQAGILLGTAAYMAPEQARGRAVDQRADIWAFGCVLYEMLTGQPAFAGEDVAMTLARVLANDTDLKSMPGAISPAVQHTIKLCLEKDAKKRIADIRDVKLALGGAFETVASRTAGDATTKRPFLRTALPMVAFLVVGVIGAGVTVWAVLRPGAPAVARFDVTPGDLNVLLNSASAVLSPDGQSIAYLAGGDASGAGQLRLRRLDQFDSTTLAAQTVALANPFFSPDGAQVGFFMREPNGVSLRRVSTQGGPASTITRVVGNLRGASWGVDGTIVFAFSPDGVASGLWRVRAAGGEAERVRTADPKSGVLELRWPEILPGGETVLFTIVGSSEEDSEIAAVSLATGEQRVLLRGGSAAHYSPTGHLIFGRAGTLFAVRFDADRLEVLGDPVPVQEGVASYGFLGATEASIASNGTLIYLSSSRAQTPGRSLVWVDQTGRERPVPTPQRAFKQLVLSPDATHAALAIEGDNAIWVSDLARGTLERLPVDVGRGEPTVLFYSADGQRIASSAMHDDRQEVVWQAVDGSGATELLMSFDASVAGVPTASLSPDGSRFVLSLLRAPGSTDLGVADLGDPNSYRDFLATPDQEFGASISPDGRWIAYSSIDTGNYQVYVQRFPEGGGRRLVSPRAGVWPRWTEDGSALTYFELDGGNFVSISRVPVTGLGAGDGAPTFGTSTQLFPWKYFALPNGENQFAMTADGERFLMITGDPQDAGSVRLVLVQNWSEELKRLVPN